MLICESGRKTASTRRRKQERRVGERGVKHTKAEYLTVETIIDLLGGFSRL